MTTNLPQMHTAGGRVLPVGMLPHGRAGAACADGLFLLCLFKACSSVAANSSFPLLPCSTAQSIQAFVPLSVCVARMQSWFGWSCTDLISLTLQAALQEPTHVQLHHNSSCLSSRASTCSCKLMQVPCRTSHRNAST